MKLVDIVGPARGVMSLDIFLDDACDDQGWEPLPDGPEEEFLRLFLVVRLLTLGSHWIDLAPTKSVVVLANFRVLTVCGPLDFSLAVTASAFNVVLVYSLPNIQKSVPPLMTEVGSRIPAKSALI